MKFKDIKFSREYRFSIGIEEESARYYLSIPVSNQLVDYEEYYEISKQQFDQYMFDLSEAVDFAEDCRKRQKDELLIQKPGRIRGEPI